MTNDKFPKEEGAEIRTATEEALALATHPKPKRGRKATPLANQVAEAPSDKPKRKVNKILLELRKKQAKEREETLAAIASEGRLAKMIEKCPKLLKQHRQALFDHLAKEFTPALPFPTTNNENVGVAEAATEGGVQ